MTGSNESLELLAVWRRRDPNVERDAEIFWRERMVFGSDTSIAERLNELCVVAYEREHGNLIAVSTAGLRQIDFLASRVAMFRCTITPEYRGRRLSYDLMTRAREVIEEWSAVNPGENVKAMATIAQTQEAHLNDAPGVFDGSGLTFVGWTANGERMRVAWFKHARIPRFPPWMPTAR